MRGPADEQLMFDAWWSLRLLFGPCLARFFSNCRRLMWRASFEVRAVFVATHNLVV